MAKELHIQELEATVAEAFAAAAQRRKLIGLPALKTQLRSLQLGPNKGAQVLMTQARGGKHAGKWVRMTYKITLYLPDDAYADLLRIREARGFAGSPATLLKHLIREMAPPRRRSVARPLLSERLKLRPGHGRAARAA